MNNRPLHKITIMSGAICLCLFFIIQLSVPVLAHTLPNGVNHDTLLEINKNHKLQLSYDISMYYHDLDSYYSTVDTNHNNKIDDDEKQSWIAFFQKYFFIISNGITYYPDNVLHFDDYTPDLHTIYPTINFMVEFNGLVVPSDLQDIEIVNTFRLISKDQQDWNFQFDPQSLYIQDVSFLDQQHIKAKWKDTKPSSLQIEAHSNPNSNTKANKTQTQQSVQPFNTNSNMNTFSYSEAKNYLEVALANQHLGVVTLITLLLVAFVFGMAHTLTPGHGKSIIGAYMAAIHGTWKDALIMGLSTTLSHTGVVILLGFFFIWLKGLIDISTYLPYLNLISGVSIIFIGAWIFYNRLQDYIHNEIHRRQHELVDDHHNHKEPHQHPKHTHDSSTHVHSVPDHRLSLREAVLLGISTGLTPCIDAIAILILAINLNRAWLGIIIILAFSIGMAGTLVLIGWGIGTGLRTAKNRTSLTWSNTFFKWLPIISSILIMVTGFLLVLQTRI